MHFNYEFNFFFILLIFRDGAVDMTQLPVCLFWNCDVVENESELISRRNLLLRSLH